MDKTAPGTGQRNPVLDVCLLIARAGCADSLAWWEDDSLSEAGLFSLRRLFPRTCRTAAIRLGLASARSRHDGMLRSSGITDARHLLDLLEPAHPVEFPTGPDEPPFDLWSAIPDRQCLQQRLEAAAGPLPPVPSGLSAAIQGLFDLSAVVPKLPAAAELAKAMAAAYLLGDRGRFVLPYVRRQS